jgi:integrase
VNLRNEIWHIQYSDGNRRYRESSHSRNKVDAERLLRRRLLELDEGISPSASGRRLKYEDLEKGIRNDYEINGRKSIKRLEQHLRHLGKEFGGKKASYIKEPRILAYIEKRLDEGAANGTINRELTTLKRMFNLARISGRLAMVPHIPMLKENNIREGFLERDQFLILYENLSAYLKPPVMFLYETGLRTSEVYNLTWEKTNSREGYVRLEPSDTKTGEGRIVYLTSAALAALKEAYKQRVLGCPYVFHRGGKQIKDPRKAWRKACIASGMPGLLLHDLRRSCVRNIIRAGIPERVAMQISGHKTRSMLDRYNIVSEQDLQEAAKKLDSYYLRSSGACQSL